MRKLLLVAASIALGVLIVMSIPAFRLAEAQPQPTMKGPHCKGCMSKMPAESQHGGHAGHEAPASAPAGHGQSAQPRGNRSASSRAFHAANQAMHEGMDIEFSGNADLDFVRGMIAHHQGAVDMAKIALIYGRDSEIRALAETIVKAQEAEIGTMQGWLKRNAP